LRERSARFALRIHCICDATLVWPTQVRHTQTFPFADARGIEMFTKPIGQPLDFLFLDLDALTKCDDLILRIHECPQVALRSRSLPTLGHLA
jgi:hypothetical protein